MTDVLTPLLQLDPAAQDLLFREARSARSFTDAPVSEDQLRALYDLVRWGPTSMNSQPLRILLVRSPEARARLLAHLWDSNRAKASSAPLIAVLAADTAFHEHLDRTFPVRPGARELYLDEAHRLEVARSQAWLQAGYFLLGVRALGLAAGPMLGFDAPGVDADLLAHTTWRSILVVNIGHPGPNAWGPRLERLDYDEVVTSI